MYSRPETILIAIQPIYVDLIVRNIKKVEFRKRISNKGIKQAFIYASTPISGIVAKIIFKKIDILKVDNLWKQYHLKGGIKRKEFFDYYNGNTFGAALVINKVFKSNDKIKLSTLPKKYAPPQNYLYLDTQSIIYLDNYIVK